MLGWSSSIIRCVSVCFWSIDKLTGECSWDCVQSLLYYDTDAYGQSLQLNKDAVFSALTSIYLGKGTPKHSENMLERLARVCETVSGFLPLLVGRRILTSFGNLLEYE